MTLIIETEHNFYASYEEIKHEIYDPTCKRSLEIAAGILSLICDSDEIYYDDSICDEDETVNIYDSKSKEYRALSDKYIYTIPRSVVQGTTNEVRREEYELDENIIGRIRDRISMKLSQIKNSIRPSKNSDKRPKIDWQGKDKLTLDDEILEKIRGY